MSQYVKVTPREFQDLHDANQSLRQLMDEWNAAEASLDRASGFEPVYKLGDDKTYYPTGDYDAALKECERCHMNYLLVERFVIWHETLQQLAYYYGEPVLSHDAWLEDYEKGKWASEAFYDRYPKYREH